MRVQVKDSDDKRRALMEGDLLKSQIETLSRNVWILLCIFSRAQWISSGCSVQRERERDREVACYLSCMQDLLYFVVNDFKVHFINNVPVIHHVCKIYA